MNILNLKPLKRFVLFLPVLSALLLCSCGKNTPPVPVSPFSDSTWEYTVEEIAAYEGTECTTYDSVYGGTCYTYPKAYQDRQGTIKYMFDGENRLMCIAWTCASDEEQDLYGFYDLIEESVNTQTGETDTTSHAGHVWYRENGNIVLSLMITSDLKALQYAYLHPDVSSPPKE
ncbi:MAG TPA: hypothetical protein DCZ40_14125 [Lachnospiraceae bacterium]|nr:hypothetical protein [Lachnospiraceae bacterium]